MPRKLISESDFKKAKEQKRQQTKIKKELKRNEDKIKKDELSKYNKAKLINSM